MYIREKEASRARELIMKYNEVLVNPMVLYTVTMRAATSSTVGLYLKLVNGQELSSK